MVGKTRQGYRDRALARWRRRRLEWWRHLRCPEHRNRRDLAACLALTAKPAPGTVLAAWCVQCRDYWLVHYGGAARYTTLARRTVVPRVQVHESEPADVMPELRPGDHVTPDPFA